MNVWGMKDRGSSFLVLNKLKNHCVAKVQESHIICEKDSEVLEVDYVVISAFAFGYLLIVGVSLLIKHSLNVDVNVVSAGKAGRLIM